MLRLKKILKTFFFDEMTKIVLFYYILNFCFIFFLVNSFMSVDHISHYQDHVPYAGGGPKYFWPWTEYGMSSKPGPFQPRMAHSAWCRRVIYTNSPKATRQAGVALFKKDLIKHFPRERFVKLRRLYRLQRMNDKLKYKKNKRFIWW